MDNSMRPSLSKDHLNSESATTATLEQGYRLVETDLNLLFFDSERRSITPYSVTYEIGFITEADSEFHQVGVSGRIPLEIRTGRFRPNFQVGDKFYTGNYEIRWSYQITNGGLVSVITVPFVVVTKGVYDFTATNTGFFDLPATVVIID